MPLGLDLIKNRSSAPVVAELLMEKVGRNIPVPGMRGQKKKDYFHFVESFKSLTKRFLKWRTKKFSIFHKMNIQRTFLQRFFPCFEKNKTKHEASKRVQTVMEEAHPGFFLPFTISPIRLRNFVCVCVFLYVCLFLYVFVRESPMSVLMSPNIWKCERSCFKRSISIASSISSRSPLSPIHSCCLSFCIFNALNGDQTYWVCQVAADVGFVCPPVEGRC